MEIELFKVRLTHILFNESDSISAKLRANIVLDIKNCRSLTQFQAIIKRRYKSFELAKINKAIEKAMDLSYECQK